MTEQEKYINALNGLKNADIKIDDEIRYPSIKALEKQIAKEPQKQTYKLLLEDGWEYACPSCKCAVGANKKDTLGLTQDEEYCSCCGQKLLWD